MQRRPDCSVCGWRPASHGPRCESCRAFYRRNGRDRTSAEVLDNWNLTIDRLEGRCAPTTVPIVPDYPEAECRKRTLSPDELEAFLASR